MRKILLTMIIAAGISTAVLAQNEGAIATATAPASATIVAPLTISKTVDMNFGNIAVSASNPGTVVLPNAGVRTATGGVTLPATTGTVTAASFSVTGEGVYTYAITLPTTATLTSGVSNTMTLSSFTSTPSGTGTLNAGAQTITVGATLTVGAGQTAGTYTNATAVPVTVVYN